MHYLNSLRSCHCLICLAFSDLHLKISPLIRSFTRIWCFFFFFFPFFFLRLVPETYLHVFSATKSSGALGTSMAALGLVIAWVDSHFLTEQKLCCFCCFLFCFVLFYFVLNDVLTHLIIESCLNKKEQIYINSLEMRMSNSNPHNEVAVLFILHPTCFSFSN